MHGSNVLTFIVKMPYTNQDNAIVKSDLVDELFCQLNYLKPFFLILENQNTQETENEIK